MSVGEECCGEVSGRSVGEKWWREVLENVGEEC